jgi:hypothetical protein
VLDTTNDDGFQRELARVAEACRERERLLARREAVHAELEAAASNIESKRAALLKEHDDVLRLESFSLSRVVTSLRGEHDQDLRRELAEREEARLALLSVEGSERDALRELRQIDDRLAALGDVEAERTRIIEARERWVDVTALPADTLRTDGTGRTGDSAAAQTEGGAEALAALVERRGVVEADLREVDQALAAAHLVSAKLAHTASIIGSGQAWSSCETWLQEGSDGSDYDREKLDAAAAGLREIDGVLGLLHRELADLSRLGLVHVDIEAREGHFDEFVSNFFHDLAIDQRVSAAATKIAQLRVEIDQVIAVVRAEGQALVAEANDLSMSREDLLR